MEAVKECPVCGGQNFSEFLVSRDYFLTGEIFTITRCNDCNFKFTNPRPEEDAISGYYESDDYISHGAGKRSFIHKIYRSARNLAIRKKFKIVKRYSPGTDLLDIGCGTGEFLKYCSGKKFNVKGIEPNARARDFARATYGLDVLGEKDLDSIQPGSLDVVTMWHVLEHVHNLNERLQKVRELVMPGGKAIIAVPNCDSWDAIKYGEFWAAFDLPRHHYHFTPLTMKKLVQKSNFTIEDIYPMKLDSYYISLLSEKYKTGSQNFARAFLSGIKSNIHARKNDNNYSSLIYICKTS